MKRGVERVCEAVIEHDPAVRIVVWQTHADGTRTAKSAMNTTLLESICDLKREGVSFKLNFGNRSTLGDTFFVEKLTVVVDPDRDGSFRVHMQAESVEKLAELAAALQQHLAIVIAPDSETRSQRGGNRTCMEALNELLERIRELDEHQRLTRTLTCFLSFQFKGQSLECGRSVKRFLELLGVRVLTGQGFEPKRVSDKVRSRLAEGTDMVVLIETKEGHSSWTRDEIAAAQAPGVFLIPLETPA